jgi:hypothetical protein
LMRMMGSTSSSGLLISSNGWLTCSRQ